jgi:hypothetical protein
MSKSTALTFAAFHPGRDLTLDDVARLAARLSKTDSPRPLVFETWASPGEVNHFVGRDSADSGAVALLLRNHLPGADVSRGMRPADPDAVIRLSTSGALPLGTGREEAALFSLHAAYQSLRMGEALGVQVVVGPGRHPERTASKIPDPTQTVLGTLLSGERLASTDAHRRIAEHRAAPRVGVTVRVGVVANHPARRRALVAQVVGALKALEAPGVRIDAVRENEKGWRSGVPGWGPVSIVGSQLLPLLGWPIAGLALPGQPDVHPAILAPPFKLPKDGAIFATTLVPGRQQPVRLSVEARSQHLAVTGGTGSGKSTNFAHLCLDDIVAKRPGLLIDPKRQLVDAILERVPKAAAGQVVVIDAADTNPVGVNPLDVGDRDPDVVVDGILAVFKDVFSDGWGPRTEDLLHAGLLTLARSGKERGNPHTLLDLPELLSSDSYRRTVVGAVRNAPALASFWAVFDGLSPAHRASIIAAPMNKLRKYVLRKNVAAVLGQSEPRFRLRDLFREDKFVLVPLNDALLGPGAAQLLGGLIVTEAWLATMERANEANPMDRPGAIYIDEVQRFLHLPTSIEDALATSRSYGVAWHVAFQGRSQVYKSFALAIELNARNKVTFAASPTDARALAMSTNRLIAEDFKSLHPFEVYIDLVSGGAPAGWFSASTLPHVPPVGHEKSIRAANARLYGALPNAAKEPASPIAADVPLVTNQRRRRS